MILERIDFIETVKEAERLLAKEKTASPEFRKITELLLNLVKLMNEKLNLNSRNSSKPPSSDLNRPRGSKKKLKAKNANQGANLDMRATISKR